MINYIESNYANIISLIERQYIKNWNSYEIQSLNQRWPATDVLAGQLDLAQHMDRRLLPACHAPQANRTGVLNSSMPYDYLSSLS